MNKYEREEMRLALTNAYLFPTLHMEDMTRVVSENDFKGKQ